MENNYEEIRMVYADITGSDFEVDQTIRQSETLTGFTPYEAATMICRAANSLLISLGISKYNLCVRNCYDSIHN